MSDNDKRELRRLADEVDCYVSIVESDPGVSRGLDALNRINYAARLLGEVSKSAVCALMDSQMSAN